MRSSRWRLAAALLLLACSLIGCSQSFDQVVSPEGTWRHTGQNGSATVVIESDGSIHFEDVPRVVLTPGLRRLADIDWSELVDVDGRWETANESNGGFFTVDVVLPSTSQFEGAGFPMQLRDGVVKDELFVFLDVLDDVQFVFERA